MALIKTKEEIEILRAGGKRLSVILQKIIDKVSPGVKTIELNNLADELIKEGGDKSAFLNYKPCGARYSYPASLCVSVNDEIVHGIPGGRILQEGDIVGLDLGLIHKKMITDMAVTVPVGKIDKETQKLLNITKGALNAGIKAIKPSGYLEDIGFAMEKFVEPYDYSIVVDLGGHGVGHEVHEDPFIPNVGKEGAGPELISGMVLALEPMLNAGNKDIKLDDDGYTFRTKDGGLSAHFEHTVVVTEDGVEILTKMS